MNRLRSTVHAAGSTRRSTTINRPAAIALGLTALGVIMVAAAVWAIYDGWRAVAAAGAGLVLIGQHLERSLDP